ncbi:MAG: hypothetical protein EOP84_20205 [Verrucomicrobiaceae bacterium]|nr:MAG: hypothetical protein EOP84_20205 [Verrucomicrobiaceae bacterium]
MLKTSEDYAAATVLAVLFCPALFGLAVAFFKARRGTVDTTHDSFKSGMMTHALNALLSPCIPAYLLYVDSRTGGGSLASVLSLPIIPVTWVLFYIGNKRIGKAASTEL